MFTLAANLIVIAHFAFILFVILGGLLAWKWPRLRWLHLAAVAWAALVAMMGWICPLTPLENWLLQQAGSARYDGSFIEQYIAVLIYPEGLTRERQIALGIFVLLLNAAVYGIAYLRRRKTASGFSS